MEQTDSNGMAMLNKSLQSPPKMLPAKPGDSRKGRLRSKWIHEVKLVLRKVGIRIWRKVTLDKKEWAGRRLEVKTLNVVPLMMTMIKSGNP